MKVLRTSGLTMRSKSRWRYFMSILVSPCCFSGRGRSDLDNISMWLQCTEISPVCVLNT